MPMRSRVNRSRSARSFRKRARLTHKRNLPTTYRGGERM